jgi:hypothetical protein
MYTGAVAMTSLRQSVAVAQISVQFRPYHPIVEHASSMFGMAYLHFYFVGVIIYKETASTKDEVVKRYVATPYFPPLDAITFFT